VTQIRRVNRPTHFPQKYRGLNLLKTRAYFITLITEFPLLSYLGIFAKLNQLFIRIIAVNSGVLPFNCLQEATWLSYNRKFVIIYEFTQFI